jgi:hypothetical protein
MKLYNPFKPHIVQNIDGTYSVRKYDFSNIAWRKLDADGSYWRLHSSPENSPNWSFTASDAMKLLSEVSAPKNKPGRDKYVSVADLKAQLALGNEVGRK